MMLLALMWSCVLCLCARMLFPGMAGSWQEYVATDLDVGGDLEDDEISGGAPMISLLPGKKFVANTRITRRYAGSRFN